MAQSVLDLIDVKFQDATGHTSVSSTDIIGMVMPFYWGESDKVSVYGRTTFYEMFPESLPIGVKTIENTDLYSGYAQIKAAFAHGAGEVEIYRPSNGWKYQNLTISKTGGVVGDSGSLIAADTKYDETKAVTVALKYAGFIPQSLAYGYENVKIGVSLSNSTDYTDGALIKINVYGVAADSTETLLETFEGAASATAKIGGESIYLEDVVNGNSMFIDVRATDNVVIQAAIAETEFACKTYDESGVFTPATSGQNPTPASFTSAFKLGIDNGYAVFNDYESSVCTLIINPFVTKSAKQSNTELVTEYDTYLKNIAEYRKNCLAVVGYPTDNNSVYSKENIQTYFNAHGSKGSKFCIAVQGQEYLSVFGQRFTLNCVGGYCGSMVNIAKEAHLNQIASGYVYGNYGGSLKKSLLSGAVIDLMEEGINSVYTSKRGNLIWGTRTRYGRQSSYFGKINVMRVTTMLLKNIFPIAIETLHTDAASNPITRASLSTMLNSIIDTYIANQDLHADSYADCSDSINTDYLTKGGTVLNIILMLHFIGLVERVSIKIIATDTSVTAEFV